MKVREALNLYNLHSNPEQLKGHNEVDTTKYEVYKIVPYKADYGSGEHLQFGYNGDNIKSLGIFVTLQTHHNIRETKKELIRVGLIKAGEDWEWRVNDYDYANEIVIEQSDEGRWREFYVLKQSLQRKTQS